MKKIMCMIAIAFCIALLSSCTNSVEYRKTTEVSGQVVNSVTGEPLDSIIVILEFTGCDSKVYAIDTTDNLGNYSFNNIPGNSEHRRLWLIVNGGIYYEYRKLLDLLTEPVSYKIIKLTNI